MPEASIGRVLFLKATATAPTAGTSQKTATDQSPFDGFITGVEIIAPGAPVGKLRYAIFRNSEQIYPENGYAERPIAGSDDNETYTAIREGDDITLVVLNDDTSTDWTVTAKITIQGETASEGEIEEIPVERYPEVDEKRDH